MIVAFALPAAAQTAADDSVRGRARPEFDAIGLELGSLLSPILSAATVETLNSFVVRPRLTASLEFDDNVFNDANQGLADKIRHLKPSLSIASDWANHALQMNVGADIGRYFENKQEDYEDVDAEIRGRYDITDQTAATLGYIFQRRHQLGSTPLTPASAIVDPSISGPQAAQGGEAERGSVIFYDKTIELGASFSTDPLLARIDAAARRSNFIDKGSTNEDDRDLWQLVLRPRLGYLFFEGTTLFVEPRYTTRIFDVNVDDSGEDPSSQTYELLTGATYDLTGVTFAEASVGVLHSRFDEPTFSPGTGFTFDGKLVWNATDLITVNARALRQDSPTTEDGFKIIATRTFSLGADWEAMDNLLVGADFGYTNSVRESDGSLDATGKRLEDRRDNIFTATARLSYFVGTNFAANASYSFLDQRSNDSTSKLSKNLWLFEITAQL